jgi:hypothetical protein
LLYRASQILRATSAGKIAATGVKMVAVRHISLQTLDKASFIRWERTYSTTGLDLHLEALFDQTALLLL